MKLPKCNADFTREMGASNVTLPSRPSLYLSCLLFKKILQLVLAEVFVSSIVVEGIETVLFFCQDILHKNKTPKYLNTPKTHNKAHSLG